MNECFKHQKGSQKCLGFRSQPPPGIAMIHWVQIPCASCRGNCTVLLASLSCWIWRGATAIPLVPSCHLHQKSQLIWALRGLVWQLSSSGLCFFSPGICSCGEIHLWRLAWLGSNGQSYWGRVAHSWAVRISWWLLSFSQPW